MILPPKGLPKGKQDMVVSGKIAPAMPCMILVIVFSAVYADEVLGFSPGSYGFHAIRGWNKYDGIHHQIFSGGGTTVQEGQELFLHSILSPFYFTKEKCYV